MKISTIEDLKAVLELGQQTKGLGHLKIGDIEFSFNPQIIQASEFAAAMASRPRETPRATDMQEGDAVTNWDENSWYQDVADDLYEDGQDPAELAYESYRRANGNKGLKLVKKEPEPEYEPAWEPDEEIG